VAIPYSPLAPWLGFIPLPGAVLGALAAVTITYLAAVHAAKRWFFARHRIV
jgi:Mg2+-importing ATPase